MEDKESEFEKEREKKRKEGIPKRRRIKTWLENWTKYNLVAFVCLMIALVALLIMIATM